MSRAKVTASIMNDSKEQVLRGGGGCLSLESELARELGLATGGWMQMHSSGKAGPDNIDNLLSNCA